MRLPLSSPPRHNYNLLGFTALATIVAVVMMILVVTVDTESEPLAPAMFNQPAYEVPVLGGIGVPSGLRCQEDELIGFLAPDRVGCLHTEILAAEQPLRASER